MWRFLSSREGGKELARQPTALTVSAVIFENEMRRHCGRTSPPADRDAAANLLALTTYGAETNTYFAVKDHLNSVHAFVDETGVIVESYEYDAWGRVLDVKDASGNSIANHQSKVGNRYLWQGREYDSQTGLYYFRARWYDPVVGRWLSNDPIGISGGLNQYVFCDNNPVNFTDPFGLRVFSEEETRKLLRDMSRQNIFQARRNHSGGGKYDFKMKDVIDDNILNDTYTLDGCTMRSDEFGNFAAGFVGYKIGWRFGVTGVILGGIYYDYDDARKKNFNNAVFDWDKDSWADISAGFQYAAKHGRRN